MMVCKDAPHACEKCGSTNLRQESDVLDTLVQLGPVGLSPRWDGLKRRPELDYFYPD